jgi:thiamine-phosphate pyrophosphorylase
MAPRCLLYYITDRSQFSGDEGSRRRDLLAKVAEATRVGVDYIQLRERDLSARELENLARDAVVVINKNSRESIKEDDPEHPASTRLLINHRTDVALAAGADGVHLRAEDITPREVRSILRDSVPLPRNRNQFFIAVSCHSGEDVIRAASAEADFAVFAPVFEKNSVPGAQPTGLTALRQACVAKIPVLALGGVTIENAASCLNAGAAGVAGIRLFQENTIDEVVHALRLL